jgi:hypothetical protein
MKLEGIRVIDLSRFLPGPMLTQAMADHGAEVIKVESVDDGEPTRTVGEMRDGVSVFFANANRGKQSLALNLKHPAGVETLMRLIEAADVVVESFRPGVAERLGVAYRQVASRSPHIVYASISAFGQTGPLYVAAHSANTDISPSSKESGEPHSSLGSTNLCGRYGPAFPKLRCSGRTVSRDAACSLIPRTRWPDAEPCRARTL